MPSISVRKLFQDNQERLQLSWAAGTSGSDNRIGVEDGKMQFALVGHLNFIHPNKVQVLGVTEVEYLNKLEAADASARLSQIFDQKMAVVIVANDLPVPYLLRDYCHTQNVPLMTSPLQSPHLMDMLRLYLQRSLAVSTVMHGVCLDVFEVGVLITGQSGLGKSELALELVSRGHGLVADDAVEIYRTGPDILEARCPPVLRDFLEVRGLGVLNVRSVFGETAVRPRKPLKLIIHLVYADDQYMQNLDRLSVQAEKMDILNVPLRKITLPVAVGRNISVLVEAAVRNYILQLRGIDSTREFLNRHNDALREDERKNESYPD